MLTYHSFVYLLPSRTSEDVCVYLRLRYEQFVVLYVLMLKKRTKRSFIVYARFFLVSVLRLWSYICHCLFSCIIIEEKSIKVED